MKMEILVRELEKKDENLWDEFVKNHPAGRFVHLSGYKKVIKEVYGHKPVYLMAKDDRIRGILPLFLIKSPFGKYLVSVPFLDYAGICAATPEAEESLLSAAIEMARKEDVRYLELRNLEEISGNLMTIKDHVSPVLSLNDTLEVMWKGFKPKMRNHIKKAEKSGLVPDRGIKYLKDFYEVFSYKMKELGTPAHSPAFFKKMIEEFGDKTRIFVVQKDHKTIGALFAILFKDTAYGPWASSSSSYFNYCPNNLLYWEAIKYSCQKGYRYFDFLRSQWGSGTFKFKEQWGAEPKQLYYQYWLKGSGRIPKIDPNSLKYRIFSSCWRKLPLSTTRIFGPMIRRYIP